MATQTQFVNDLVTPVGRLSFPHLEKPDTEGRYATGKFKAELLIPKSASMQALIDGVTGAAQAAWGVTDLAQVHHPFIDGDTKADKNPAAAGCWIVRAKSKRRPLLLQRDKTAATPADLYAGCDARMVVAAMTYEGRDGPGVTLLLETVQKVSDNEPFGRYADTSVLDDLSDSPDMSPAQPQQAMPPAQPQQAMPPAQPQQAMPPAQPQQAMPPAQPQQAMPPAQPQQAMPPAQPQQAMPPAQPQQAMPPAQPQQPGSVADLFA